MTNNLTNSGISFNDINDTHCSCLEEALFESDKEYVKKVSNPSFKERDFKSKWEKISDDEKLEKKQNCKEVCGAKGISCNEWNDLYKDKIIKKYKEMGNFAPKSKDGIIIFKIKKTAGAIKYTPTQKDASHHDFYKCDSFDFKIDLDVLSYKPLDSF